MTNKLRLLAASGVLSCTLLGGFAARAAITSSVRGVVHDPQHRPLPGAKVAARAVGSEFEVKATTDQEGRFLLPDLVQGDFVVIVSAAGFAEQREQIRVASGTAPVLHFQLGVAPVEQRVDVQALAQANTTTTETMVSRAEIDRYAGVNDSNSLRIVTDFVPGAYVVHDQLHVRGGHQVTWALDGVPLPDTNIAANVGARFDPKDIDSLEVQRGGYSAEYGDRTYGVLNVATRTGFEREHQAEIVLQGGNYNRAQGQASIGDHTERSAWYVSANGNRGDYGLEPPSFENRHNQNAGGGVFASGILNRRAAEQLRFIGGFRGDFFQVPNDPEKPAAGLNDREREQDGFATFTWMRSFPSGAELMVSPFYHFNRAAFEGSASDAPSVVNNRSSHYPGGQLVFSETRGMNTVRAGVYGFTERTTNLFSVSEGGIPGRGFPAMFRPAAQLEAAFLEDQFRPREWLTLSGGMRLTHYAAGLNENSADPRVAASVRVPRLGWVGRASYARYYQAPPAITVAGPLAQFAQSQGVEFLPLHGERDEQSEFGLLVPVRGWEADFAYFRTAARNFFDHDVIGNSNIFLPVTIARARIAGWESTVRSPLLLRSWRGHLAYSNQRAQGFGGVTGGLSDGNGPDGPGFYLDHDQRNTLSLGANGSLPLRIFAAVNMSYGSGFLNGNGPGHLPSYRTFDLALGRNFGEDLTVRVMTTNVTDKRYRLDLSNTFGGSHVGDPRMISGEVRYRFHY